ncbi:MAG: hypothetical protein GY870_04730 [archaeon]|nr:hypothetical protein [archaeon]
MVFFENLTTTQDLATAEEKPWPGGSGGFCLAGVPDGLIATLWFNTEDIGYAVVTGSTLSNTTGQFIFELPEGKLKVVVTGTAGSSSDISCSASGYLSS